MISNLGSVDQVVNMQNGAAKQNGQTGFQATGTFWKLVSAMFDHALWKLTTLASFICNKFNV